MEDLNTAMSYVPNLRADGLLKSIPIP